MMQNKVELIEGDIIYVEKVGNQTIESMSELYEKVAQLSRQLRARRKPVLVLSNAEDEGEMDIGTRQYVAKIGKELDYDKSATYGLTVYRHEVRELMISATQLGGKVANFKSRPEALKWLLQ